VIRAAEPKDMHRLMEMGMSFYKESKCVEVVFDNESAVATYMKSICGTTSEKCVLFASKNTQPPPERP